MTTAGHRRSPNRYRPAMPTPTGSQTIAATGPANRNAKPRCAARVVRGDQQRELDAVATPQVRAAVSTAGRAPAPGPGRLGRNAPSTRLPPRSVRGSRHDSGFGWRTENTDFREQDREINCAALPYRWHRWIIAGRSSVDERPRGIEHSSRSRIEPLKPWVTKTAERLHMPVEARAEGGCTGHGPGHGREAGAGPGARARDVTQDVAPLVLPPIASVAGAGAPDERAPLRHRRSGRRSRWSARGSTTGRSAASRTVR